jgi:hypothetical protein
MKKEDIEKATIEDLVTHLYEKNEFYAYIIQLYNKYKQDDIGESISKKDIIAIFYDELIRE